MRDPEVLRARRSPLVTAHKRNPGTRPADKERQRDLLVGHALTAAGALPQPGGQKLHVKEVGLLEIARRMGKMAPESACRIIHKDGTPLIQSVRAKGHCTYIWAAKEKKERTFGANYFNVASPAELATDPDYAGMFAEDDSTKEYGKFVKAVYDPCCPLTDSEREVFTFLFRNGIYKQNASGQWKSGSARIGGERNYLPTQEQIGANLGKHRDTIARALNSLAERGIIKIIRKPGHYEKNGKVVPKGTDGAMWKREEPDEYIGICDWVETERERYNRLMEPVRAAKPEMAKLMDRIYGETVREWLEEAKQQKTFHRECRARMEAEGVEMWQLDIVFPSPPS